MNAGNICENIPRSSRSIKKKKTSIDPVNSVQESGYIDPKEDPTISKPMPN